jgi:hypothetical protein
MPPLRGSVAAAGSCGCGSVRLRVRAAAGPCGCGFVRLRVRAAAGSCGCGFVRLRVRAAAGSCGCGFVRLRVRTAAGLCGCRSMRLPRGYVAAKGLCRPTRLCGGCAVSYLVVRRIEAGAGEVMVESENEERRVGLCTDCEHARRIESDRGSVFWRCELSATDPRFPKYPRLPVLECDGYKRSVQERS